jgi:hypothetical protein
MSVLYFYGDDRDKETNTILQLKIVILKRHTEPYVDLTNRLHINQYENDK